MEFPVNPQTASNAPDDYWPEGATGRTQPTIAGTPGRRNQRRGFQQPPGTPDHQQSILPSPS